jgi:hypothetical protein
LRGYIRPLATKDQASYYLYRQTDDRQYTCRVVYETIIVPPKTAATKIGKMLGRRQNFHPSAALSRDDHHAHSRAFALPLRRDGVHK